MPRKAPQLSETCTSLGRPVKREVLDAEWYQRQLINDGRGQVFEPLKHRGWASSAWVPQDGLPLWGGTASWRGKMGAGHYGNSKQHTTKQADARTHPKREGCSGRGGGVGSK